MLTPARLLAWYGILSAVMLALFWKDKEAARNGRWRTRESTLLLLALFGGWPGAWMGQRVFRHKSRKRDFRARLTIAGGLNIAGLWLAAQMI